MCGFPQDNPDHVPAQPGKDPDPTGEPRSFERTMEEAQDANASSLPDADEQRPSRGAGPTPSHRDTFDRSDDSADEAAREANEPVSIDRRELDGLRKKAAESDNYLDMLQRARAEFLNYQKRMRKEMDALREGAIHDFASELLPILDDFARAIAALDSAEARTDEDHKGFADGVKMIEAQLHKALEKHQIKPIAAKGQPFDPTYHEAVMQQPSDDQPGGTVLEELRRGYTAGDRVLRAAQVIVAAAANGS